MKATEQYFPVICYAAQSGSNFDSVDVVLKNS